MWPRLLPLLSLLWPSLCLSTSLPSMMKPSQVFYIPMPSLPYRMFCPPSGGPCSYESRLDPEKEKKLLAAYSKSSTTVQKSRQGKQGRDIGKLDPYTWKPNTRQATLNFIQTEGVEEKPWKKKEKLSKKGVNKKVERGNIFRPKVNFVSNARPARLQWRELEVKKTPIIKAKPLKLDYNTRLKKKYGNSPVPVHLGYSRNFVEDSPRRRYRGAGSTTTWLSHPARVNGLPQTVLHWQYPLKVASLSANTV